MMLTRLTSGIRPTDGFTLIEVVIVIIITGIMFTVALRTGGQLFNSANIEATKHELGDLTVAMVGDPELYNSSTRSSFGYVGDVGSLPPNLDALMTNPGAYSSWRGPYVTNRLEQMTTDYKVDAWQTPYIYSGGLTIASSGSGDTIIRVIAPSVDDLLVNQVNGIVTDADGQPPGSVFKDSVMVNLTVPGGSGGWQTKTVYPDLGGYFSYDSVPIGNHDLQIIFLPTSDTLDRFVTVLPNSSVYSEHALPISTWAPAGGSLTFVTGSVSIGGGGPNCDQVAFNVTNSGTTDIDLSSLTISWPSPTTYYKRLRIGNTQVFNNQNPRAGSGDTVTFPSIVIGAGQTVEISVLSFCDIATGGCSSKTNIQNVDFTFLFSDGSSMSFTTGSCP